LKLISQFVLAAVLATVSVGAITARAQEHKHEHPTGEITGPAAEFYERWRVMPARDMSCCNKKDCYVTSFRRVGNDWFALIRETQEWKLIPANRLEHNASDPEESPDGANHICASA
jgi:hypothetical protein